MKTIAIASICASLIAGPGNAAEKKPAPASTAPSTSITYRPPNRGAPKARVDGASRAGRNAPLSLFVIAPKELAYTSKAEPVLFWYGTPPRAADIIFTLNVTKPRKVPKPIVRVPLTYATNRFLQPIRLGDYQVMLDPALQYSWSVSVQLDPQAPSKNVVATGGIRMTNQNAELQQRLATLPLAQHAWLYAEHGLWFDAMEVLEGILEKEPNHQDASKWRSELLNQVGLSEVAPRAR